MISLDKMLAERDALEREIKSLENDAKDILSEGISMTINPAAWSIRKQLRAMREYELALSERIRDMRE